MIGDAGQWAKFTSIAVPDRMLEDGELADIPTWKVRAVHTPGHTPVTCASWTSDPGGSSPAIMSCRG